MVNHDCDLPAPILDHLYVTRHKFKILKGTKLILLKLIILKLIIFKKKMHAGLNTASMSCPMSRFKVPLSLLMKGCCEM